MSWSSRRRAAHHAHVDERLRERDSTRTHASRRTAASANRPTPRLEPQPQLALAHAESRATSQADSSAAPAQSTRRRRADRRLGDEDDGATAAITIATSGIQKSQWYERCSMIGPASTIPTPPPMPRSRGDERDPGRDPLGRELVADDPEREREDRAADALDDAADDHAPRSTSRAPR